MRALTLIPSPEGRGRRAVAHKARTSFTRGEGMRMGGRCVTFRDNPTNRPPPLVPAGAHQNHVRLFGGAQSSPPTSHTPHPPPPPREKKGGAGPPPPPPLPPGGEGGGGGGGKRFPHPRAPLPEGEGSEPCAPRAITYDRHQPACLSNSSGRSALENTFCTSSRSSSASRSSSRFSASAPLTGAEVEARC